MSILANKDIYLHISNSGTLKDESANTPNEEKKSNYIKFMHRMKNAI